MKDANEVAHMLAERHYWSGRMTFLCGITVDSSKVDTPLMGAAFIAKCPECKRQMRKS